MSVTARLVLSRYRIVSPLGEGGMGAVYRARDTKLEREVAIKILSEALATDPAALARFEREAQAVATLSHPNILGIHDFGVERGTPYAVMELLEGQTLRELMGGAAVPPRKAVEYALQIAAGLAAAHAGGITHRDIKPENVFVTRDGHVKILDFGLAKQRQAAPADATVVTTRNMSTEPGMVMGTVGYMAPEQIRGQPIDHRVDIFAFGAVLYELLAGRRAFQGATPADTASAVLKEDPPELATTAAAHIPPSLDRIVRRCLEKNPDERFQSARDVAFALEAMSGSSVATGPSAAVTQRKRRPWMAIAAVLAVAAALAAAFVVGRSSGPSGPSRITRLTYRHGQVDAARFAPDGQTIVYSASWNGSPYEVFSTRLDSTESRALGFPGTVLAAVSATGDMALLRNAVPFIATQPTAQEGMLARAPLAGGSARDLAEAVQFAEWSPDGKQLAVVRFLDGKSRLECPIGRVLYETGGLIANPRFSPRGDRIAFLDILSVGFFKSAVSIVDLSGQRTVLATSLTMTNGLAWSPSGEEVWFAGGRNGLAKDLYAVTLSGRERIVFRTLTGIHLFDIGADGRVLLAQELRRRELWGRAPGAVEDRDLSWMDTSAPAQLATDGKRLVFNEQGEGGGSEYSVYLRAMDGSVPVRIGSGSAFDLSADGKWILTIAHYGTPSQRIVLLPTGAGQPRELPTEPLTYQALYFGPGGRTIIFSAMKPGEAPKMYMQDINAGGTPRAFGEGMLTGISDAGLTLAEERIVVRDSSGQPFLQSLTEGNPKPIHGISPNETSFGRSKDGWLYVFARSGGPRTRVFLVDPATGRREFWKEIGPADATGVWPPDSHYVTPDGEAYIYSFARRLSDLYVVEGLR
ncbi:MAG: protein kinase [Acidobacteria bacterium]|nr:protein kinase [Acidobacteriota bacterium]